MTGTNLSSDDYGQTQSPVGMYMACSHTCKLKKNCPNASALSTEDQQRAIVFEIKDALISVVIYLLKYWDACHYTHRNTDIPC